ncbi:MAG: hypothetical protein QFB89_01085, partial [Pseudomonadota bacterium]|nr:hypothetical protein [Pseudomonadota bacterium]
MSARHPIISITGSSGAGTTSVKQIFEQIFRREHINAAFIEGDAFHRYDRAGMADKIAEEQRLGNPNFTHFHADANELERLEDEAPTELYPDPPPLTESWGRFDMRPWTRETGTGGGIGHVGRIQGWVGIAF